MLNVLDLFAGAGGFSLGMHMAGFDTIGAIEVDRFAAETFSFNFPKTKVFRTSLQSFGDSEIRRHFSGVDVIVGGPPCQGFSVAGPSQYGVIDQKRNNLVLQYIRFVEVLRPRICVIENVPGILSGMISEKKRARDEIFARLQNIGYQIDARILQAADFGVPQWRQRAIIVGVRGEEEFQWPTPKFTEDRSNWVTVADAIGDLPVIKSGEGTEDLVRYPVGSSNSYQRRMRQGVRGVFNHVAMIHTKRILDRFRHIPIGGSIVDAPAAYGQRLRNGSRLDVRRRFKMNNQRLDPNRVSLAITASFQSNFVHPLYDRNLTAREGARLQSFPDHFRFSGPRTLMSKNLLLREGRDDEIGLSQYNQIGNAIPPFLSRAIGLAVVRTIQRHNADSKIPSTNVAS